MFRPFRAQWQYDGQQMGSRRFTGMAMLEVLGQLPALCLLDVGLREGWSGRSMIAEGIGAIEALLM